MGEWDYYCLLCSAGFHIPYVINDELEFDTLIARLRDQDPSPLAVSSYETLTQNVQWLKDFRLIGQNRQATGIKQCYLSGPANELEYGQARMDFGDHHNARDLPDQIVRCYRAGGWNNPNFPIHNECLVILCEAFAAAQGREYSWTPDSDSTALPFDLDVLYTCLSGKTEGVNCFFRLKRGLTTDQYFFIDLREVFYYFDPRDSISLPQFSTDAKQEEDQNGPPEIVQSTKDDLFTSLPTELILKTIAFIDGMDLVAVVRTSKTFFNICNTNAFWRRRLFRDAPWFREAKHVDDRTIDWHKLYNLVLMQAERPRHLAQEAQHVSGLANRQRIWDNAQEIIGWYEQIQPLTKVVSHPQSTFAIDAVCHSAPRVATQKDPQIKSEVSFFFADIDDTKCKKSIKFYWWEGVLCGIHVKTNAGNFAHGLVEGAHEEDEAIEFDEEDWISKFVLNLSWPKNVDDPLTTWLGVTGIVVHRLSGPPLTFRQTKGHKRLLEPSVGHGIVGLKTEFSQERIVRFGWLEHDRGPAPARSIVPEKFKTTLWNPEFPPLSLDFKDVSSGYWTHDQTWELTAMEFLILGQRDQELADIVLFAGSIKADRFEIHRRDGSIQSIGVAQAPMKRYRIDGPGGERILGYDLGLGAYPAGVRFITNRDRYLIFGSICQNARQHFHGQGHGFAGIYGNFDGRHPCAFGMIQSSNFTTAIPDFTADLDTADVPWDLRPPPASWRATGPLYGSVRYVDSFAFIDFSRPVLNLHFAPLGQQGRPNQLGIAFAITYADELHLARSTCFGTGSPVWPIDANIGEATFHSGSGSEPRVDSIRLLQNGNVGDEIPSDTEKDETNMPSLWKLDDSGEKLVAVSFWAAEFLSGVQFHSASGNSSPRWGKCAGEPTASIQAGGPENVVGIKVILSALRRMSMHAFPYPQAVQALTLVVE